MSVTFDGKGSTASNASIVSYSWTFGDRAQATGATTSHTFTTAGTYYTVSSPLSTARVCPVTVSTPIVVSRLLPGQCETYCRYRSQRALRGEAFAFTFDASQSSDSDGSITQYSWDFGDGTTGTERQSSIPTPRRMTIRFRLQVTDHRGGAAAISIEIVLRQLSLPISINIEMAEVTIDHNWTTVVFENTFSHPVIIAGPPTTFNEVEPVLVRFVISTTRGLKFACRNGITRTARHAQERFSYW